MLDPHMLREDPEGVASAVAKRRYQLEVGGGLALDARGNDQQKNMEN